MRMDFVITEENYHKNHVVAGFNPPAPPRQLFSWERDDVQLSDEQLHDINDIYATVYPAEVRAVLSRLTNGRVDGTSYGDGTDRTCSCLLGTLGAARNGGKKLPHAGDHFDDESGDYLDETNDLEQLLGITPDGSRPAEHAFWPLRPGDKPTNHRRALDLAATAWELMLSNPRVFGRVGAGK